MESNIIGMMYLNDGFEGTEMHVWPGIWSRASGERRGRTQKESAHKHSSLVEKHILKPQKLSLFTSTCYIES